MARMSAYSGGLIVKVIDVTKSYTPIDPASLSPTEQMTVSESYPYSIPPDIAYEGYNFMPTSYGYKSYFGTNNQLDIPALPSRCDHILILQSDTLQNLLVAMCEDGIWMKLGSDSDPWIHDTVLDVPPPGKHYKWTYCVISNTLYMYRQGGPAYYKLRPEASPYTCEPVTPNFLNMAGQEGIFKAGGRLGFWDSLNSVSWSSLDDLADFTSALETMAGNSIFTEVMGRITTILGREEDFVIYATKSILEVVRDTTGSMMWKANLITNTMGVVYPEQACIGFPDSVQYCITSKGELGEISGSQMATIVPEVMDFLKDSRKPIYLKLIQGRFLCLEMMDERYITGKLDYTTFQVPPLEISWPPIPDDVVSLENTSDQFNALMATLNGLRPDMLDHMAADGVPKDARQVLPYWNTNWSQPNAFDLKDPDWNQVPILDAYGQNFYLAPADSEHPVTPSDLGWDGTPPGCMFIAVQQSIWDKANDQRDDLISALKDRTLSQTNTTDLGFMTPPANSDVTTKTLVATLAGEIDWRFRTGVTCTMSCNKIQLFADQKGTTKVYHDIRRTKTYQSTPWTPELVAPVVSNFWSGYWAKGNYSDYASAMAAEQALYTWVTEWAPAVGSNPDPTTNAPRRYTSTATKGTWTGTAPVAEVDYATNQNIVPNGYYLDTSYTKKDSSVSTEGSKKYSDTRFIVYNYNLGDSTIYTDPIQCRNAKVNSWVWNYKNGVAPVSTVWDTPDEAALKTPHLDSRTDQILLWYTCTWADKSTHRDYVNRTLAPIPGWLLDFDHAPNPDGGNTYISTKAWAYINNEVQANPWVTLTETLDIPEGYVDNSDTVLSTLTAEADLISWNYLPKDSDTWQAVSATDAMCKPISFDPPVGGYYNDMAHWPNWDLTWPQPAPIVVPGTKFLLKDGSPEPIYPDMVGAFVYDIALKQWGKAKVAYKKLLDYAPLNSPDGGIIPFDVFGVDAGLLDSSGNIYLFDDNPADSYIRYGKFAVYRFGTTTLQELTAQFRTPCTGYMSIESSMDGDTLDGGLVRVIPFTNATYANIKPSLTAKWHTVRISGKFDLKYLEYKSYKAGRR